MMLIVEAHALFQQLQFFLISIIFRRVLVKFDTRGFKGDLTVTALAGNDVIIGGKKTNLLNGGAGDDHYVLRGLSDTLMDTDGGIDLIDYSFSANGVKVKLSKTGNQSVNGTAVLSLQGTFEYIAGSEHNDKLIGNSFNNVIFGGGGDDVLNGLGGVNLLIGGLGNDVLIIGQGLDFPQQEGERPFADVPFVTVPSAVALFLKKAPRQTPVSESLLRILAGSPIADLA